MKQYGFNVLWMFTTDNRDDVSVKDIAINEKELDFMCQMGCNFVRIPMDYRFWIKDFKYYEPDEKVVKKVEECVKAVTSRKMHCSLNIHRAPGYCINGNELEKHNLWLESEAQDAFKAQWVMFANLLDSVPAELLSFDLLNEPANIGQYGLTRENHAAIMRSVANAIRNVTPERPITLDGLGGGNIAMPELVDLDVTMSTRGYQPMTLTHYEASWCPDTKGTPYPVWPNEKYDGKIWNKQTLREHYAPWKVLADNGCRVHVGEFGVYNHIDNKIALAWLEDLLDVYNELGFGYSLWNFDGDFGIIGHNRPGTRLEKIGGYDVDIDMYEIYKNHMIQ